MKKKDIENRKKILAYSSVGMIFPVSIAIGLFIGYFLDSVFNTDPLLLIIFTLYGVIAGFYSFFKMVKRDRE